MPKTNKIIQSFNSGELSPLMDSRIDQSKYVSGCRICENFIPLIYGGAERRPGLEYIATQKSSSAKGRVVAFERSVDDVYMLCFENQVIRVFRSGARVTGTATNITVFANYGGTVSGTVKATSASHGLITGDMATIAGTTSYNGDFSVTKVDANNFYFTDTWVADDATGTVTWSGITTPYLTADLPTLKFEHSADTKFITHPDYEPRKLARTGHTNWTLTVLGIENGAFRDQNTDTADTIVADGTTGSVTLTAVGCTPFVAGTTAGHSPSGALATSKSQTGALFKLVHALGTPSVTEELESETDNDATGTLAVYKGITWDFTTQGTWGAADDPCTVVLERTYDAGTTYETVITVTSAANKNVTTSGTETLEDALYRVRVDVPCTANTSVSVQLSVRDTSHIGIVKITAVASTTSATATVLATLGSTDKTHRWSEGAFSNYRGWPIDVTISPEERLTFTGSPSEPLTTWGSVIGDYYNFKEGVLDDDAIIHTLIGSGQQNQIQWALTKTALVLGTVGGEHVLGASSEEEALTPTNVKAKLQTTYGSENIAALIVNRAVLFLQRGGRKIREFLYNFEAGEKGGYDADDLTVFAEHITKSGIVDMAFQRTPDPALWCVRDDGELAVMTYERKQDVFSWCRIVTDGLFESVDVIYGGAGKEDEVWVTVKREIEGSTARYIERFANRGFEFLDEIMFLDSAVRNESAYDAQDIILASDTVRCNNGLCNSSLCGGVPA